MKAPHFVLFSALLLIAWLASTFFYVPHSNEYQMHGQLAPQPSQSSVSNELVSTSLQP